MLASMVQEMFLALVVNKSGTWMSWYLNWREFGHRSLFGESCMSDMTDVQTRLVSMTHLYDVIQSDFGIEQEVPKHLMPFPHELAKWYDDVKKKLKEKREQEKRDSAAQSQSGKGKYKSSSNNAPVKPRAIYNESDGAAFSAMRRGKREPN